MDTHTSITSISLFSGCGGLSLGIHAALGHVEPLLYVEREFAACEILAVRMEEGSIPSAPIFTDITRCNCTGLRGKVDIVEGGFPCQDLSHAGKRAGISGAKSGLWHDMLRIAKEAEAPVVFAENVPGILTSLTILHRADLCGALSEILDAAESAPSPQERWKLESTHRRLHGRLLKKYGISALLYVCCGLEEAGYQVKVGIFSAEEIGASHQRQRVFILGYKPGYRLPMAEAQSGRLGVLRESPWSNGQLDGGYAAVADTEDINGRSGVGGEEAGSGTHGVGRRGSTVGSGGGLGHPDQPRLEGWEQPSMGSEWEGRQRVGESSGAELGHPPSDDELRDSLHEPGGQREVEAGGSGRILCQCGSEFDAGDDECPGCWRIVADGNGARRDRGTGIGELPERSPLQATRSGDGGGEAEDSERPEWRARNEAGRDEPDGEQGRQEGASGSSVSGYGDRPAMANSSDRLVPQQGRGPKRRDGTRPGSEEVADANRERRQQGSKSAFGNEEADGREGWHEQQSNCDHVSSSDGPDEHNRYADLPLFAPGPSSRDWPGIIERWPELSPAISTEALESALRGMATGDSTGLDRPNRTDQLRSLGNMVCPAAAYKAFVELGRRAGII